MAEIDDILNAAKGSLSQAADLSKTSGLDAANAENAKNQAAFEQHKAEAGLTNPVGRFLGGAWNESIINPSNWGGVLSSIVHPVKSIIEPSSQAFVRAIKAPSNAEAATELMRAVPIVGNPTVNATDRMLGGDVAGGLGQLAGEVSNFPVAEYGVKAIPGATSLAGKGTSAVGRGMQAAAEKLSNAKVNPSTAAILELATGHPYAAAATAATPVALKYGGKLTETAGNAIQGLGGFMKDFGTPAEAPYGPDYPESYKPAVNRARVSSEIPTAPPEGWGAPETYTRPTQPGNVSISNSPAMQGLRQAVDNYRGIKTTEAMINPATEASYGRGSPAYSDEALQWLQAHTPKIDTSGMMSGDRTVNPSQPITGETYARTSDPMATARMDLSGHVMTPEEQYGTGSSFANSSSMGVDPSIYSRAKTALAALAPEEAPADTQYPEAPGGGQWPESFKPLIQPEGWTPTWRR